MKKLGANAYFLELSSDIHLSPIFNVEDLSHYDGHDEENCSKEVEDVLPQLAKTQDLTEAILDDQVVSTHCGGYHKFLIKWKNKPISDCCQLKTIEVQWLNPKEMSRGAKEGVY